MQLKLELLAIISSVGGNQADAAHYLGQMIDLLKSLPNISGFLLVLTGIVASYGHMGNYQQAVELIAITINHPQFGGVMQHRAEKLLNDFQPKLAKATFQQIMDKAEQGQLDYSFLGSGFGVNAQMITELSVLLDQAAAACYEGQ